MNKNEWLWWTFDELMGSDLVINYLITISGVKTWDANHFMFKAMVDHDILDVPYGQTHVVHSG